MCDYRRVTNGKNKESAIIVVLQAHNRLSGKFCLLAGSWNMRVNWLICRNVKEPNDLEKTNQKHNNQSIYTFHNINHVQHEKCFVKKC